MPFDGSTWNESLPTNSDLANEIDDYMRDIKIGVRSRMENEHVWSSSQTATGSDGQHKFITLSTQTSTPSLVYGTSTQAAAIFAGTDNNVKVVDKAGTVYTIVKSGVGVALAAGTGTLGAIPYITSGGGVVLLGAGTSGHILTAAGAAAPAWAAPTPTVLGSWVDKSGGYGAQQATSDGFVVASSNQDTLGNEAVITGYTDGNTDPSTLRCKASSRYNGGSYTGGFATFTMPVKKSDYWKVVVGGGTPSVYWIPLGT